MKKQSIIDIENQLQQFNEAIQLFKNTQSEQRNLNDIVHEESSVNDFIMDISFIYTQVSYLVKSHKVFLKISSLSERQNINSYLANLTAHLNQSNFAYIDDQINHLKALLRNFHVFFKKDYVSDFYDELQKLQTEQKTIEGLLKSSKKTKEDTDKIFVDLEDKANQIEQKIEDLTSSYSDLDHKVTSATEKEHEISELFNSSKSHEGVITDFSTRVEKREQQLIKQQSKTEEYEKYLEQYGKQQQEILTESKKLIDSAKKALKYKTAEGISASIQGQYENAKSKWSTVPWLLSAVIFVVLTLLFGFLIVGGSIEILSLKLNYIDISDNWSLLVGRIILLPILITGAVFSAKQYTKQKNIIEDYAYKMVLTQSIVGFSEQLLKIKDTNEGYQAYIEKVLEELLQDPLRERKIKDESVEEKAKDIVSNVADIAGKFLPKNK